MKNNIKIFFNLTLIIILLNFSNTKDLFEDYYEKAEEMLKAMDRNEKIGQIFLGRYSLDTVDDEIVKYSPGGFVLFNENLENHTEEGLIQELNERQNISKILLGFGVDEEGGTVCRVSKHFRKEEFPSPRESYVKGGIEEILSIEKEKRDLLRKLKFNFNLAPVADISFNEEDYIYKRTLGENASLTSDYINKVEDSYYKDNFTCCLKHFPGYGNNSDTHEDVVHDYRPLDYLKENDLVPFVKAINHKAPMIMFSHNIVVDIDEKYPSSLSKKVHDLLRNDYGYTGLIVTDSLSMAGITKYTLNTSAAVLAVQAGNDLLLTSTLEKHVNELIEGVDKGEVDMKVIEKAAKRVLAWKLKYLYAQDDDNENNAINIVLYVVLGVSTLGLFALFGFIIYQYFKKDSPSSDEDSSRPSKNILLRDTNNNSESDTQ